MIDSEKDVWAAEADFSNQVSHFGSWHVVVRQFTKNADMVKLQDTMWSTTQEILHAVIPTAFEIKLLIRNSQRNSLAIDILHFMWSYDRLCWVTQGSWPSPATETATLPTQVQQVQKVSPETDPFPVAKAATTSTVMLHGAASDAPRLVAMHCIEALVAPSETQWNGTYRTAVQPVEIQALNINGSTRWTKMSENMFGDGSLGKVEVQWSIAWPTSSTWQFCLRSCWRSAFLL